MVAFATVMSVFTFIHFIDKMYCDRVGGKYRGCLCVCLCVSVCLSRAVWRNYWADFDETFKKIVSLRSGGVLLILGNLTKNDVMVAILKNEINLKNVKTKLEI